MLGLYLGNLINGHKGCRMLSILKLLSLLKRLQSFMTK